MNKHEPTVSLETAAALALLVAKLKNKLKSKTKSQAIAFVMQHKECPKAFNCDEVLMVMKQVGVKCEPDPTLESLHERIEAANMKVDQLLLLDFSQIATLAEEVERQRVKLAKSCERCLALENSDKNRGSRLANIERRLEALEPSQDVVPETPPAEAE